MASRVSAFPFTLSLVLWLCVLTRAQETTAQLPTSTPLPDGDQQATVGWVSNPKRRGTLTLIIECLTTIFACTWTVLHLNVPAIADSTTTRVLRKAKWMAITILFPEFIFAKAVCELRFALYTLDRMCVSVRVRPKDFEMAAEVKDKIGASAWVLWAWTVEFEPVKRILYRILLWGKPQISYLYEGYEAQGIYTPTTSKIIFWLSKFRSTLRHYSSPNVVSSDTLGESSAGLHREREFRVTRRVPSVNEEGKLVMEDKTFVEKSFSEKDRDLNGSMVARVQKWTLTHAYYVNMGGIVARKRMKEWTSEERSGGMQPYFTHSYSVVRGDHLALRYLKTWELGQPLKELRLSADDIKDKSKADWIVKIIAVIQIARLLFDLITRGVGGQPVTQLEIATASFSIFAIVTYLANWWKPKDISQPTRLDTEIEQGIRGDPVNRETEPFLARLWSPTPPAHYYEDTMSPRVRIPNDELWVGRTSAYPLPRRSHSNTSAWSLMATSCLVFGGIHCIAWSFQFPTQVEQLAWRIAALVSTTLPVIALAGSFTILRYKPRDLKRRMTAAVEETLNFYDGLLRRDVDGDWWGAFTTAVSTSAWNEWIETHTSTEQNMARDMERLRWELEMLAKLRSSLQEMGGEYGSRDQEVYLNTVWDTARSLKTSGGQDVALRGHYEEWMKHTRASRYGGVFQWFFSLCAREPASVQSYQEARKDFDIRAQRLSRLLNIISGIIYTAARLVLLAIMFSSLRAVPDGVYDTANWTRFMPSFS